MRILLVIGFLLTTSILLGQSIEDTRINEEFNNTALSKVIRTLKNKYDINVSYDDALILGVSVSGKFKNTPLTTFLDGIFKNAGID